MLWIINGSSFLAITVAVDTIPPLLSAGLRFAIQALSFSQFIIFKVNLKCNMTFEDKRRLENHKKTHERKSKVSEYGDPDFNIDRLRG